jgi:O-antigen ligase
MRPIIRARGRGDPHVAARRRYVRVAAASLLCIVLAFHQVLPKPTALSTDLSASRGLELALVGCALLLALAMPRSGPRLPYAAGLGFGLVICFTAWAFVTAFWSPLPITASVKALELAGIAVVAWRLAAGAPGMGAERRRAVSDAVVYAVLLALVALVVANLVAMGSPLPIVPDESDPLTGLGRNRLMLGYNHPLSSAALLALGIVFAFDSTLRPLAKTAVMGGLAVLLLLCDARGITTALPGGLLLAVFLRAKPSLLLAWAAAMVVFAGVGGVLLLLAHVDAQALMAQLFGDDVRTLNSRSGLWAYVVELALQHPLRGVGYYGSRVHLLSAFPFAGHAHNTFLEMLLATGLPGLTLGLGFVAVALVQLLRTGDPVLGGLLPLMLVEGNLNPILFVPTVPMLLFTLALLSAAPAWQSRRLRSGGEPADWNPHMRPGFGLRPAR